MCVNRINHRKMQEFDKGMENEKEVFCLVVSPMLDLRPLKLALQCSTTEPQKLFGKQGHHRVHMYSHLQFTARLSLSSFSA